MNSKTNNSHKPVREGTLAHRFSEALIEGDADAAMGLLESGLQSGTSAQNLYVEVIGPALERVGQLWADGEIDAAREHLATGITWGHLEYLRSASPRRPAIDAHAVVACVEGEQHALGARLVADALYLDGWNVDFLGANVPAGELAGFVKDRDASLLALSVILDEHRPAAARTVSEVRARSPLAKIVIGGPGAGGEQGTAEAGADGYAASATDAVRLARELIGLSNEITLEQMLGQVGGRIESARRAHGMSQQQLAEVAKLDRTYISAVERGKQNVSLAALLKLATALEVQLASLVSE